MLIFQRGLLLNHSHVELVLFLMVRGQLLDFLVLEDGRVLVLLLLRLLILRLFGVLSVRVHVVDRPLHVVGHVRWVGGLIFGGR